MQELLLSADEDIVAPTEENSQLIMHRFSATCDAFGLTISLRKTKKLFTPPLGVPHNKANNTCEKYQAGDC